MATEMTVDIMGAVLVLQRDIMFLRERVTKLERENAEYKKWHKAYFVPTSKDNETWG